MKGTVKFGRRLEEAVKEIESILIKENPAFARVKWTIEKNRVFTVNGVKHEIDVLVDIDLGDGYSAKYFFECKRRRKKVGKNDIVLFSEKIRALGAAKGFFVAEGYSRYALAQTKQDPRIELLTFKDVSLDLPIQPIAKKGVPKVEYYITLKCIGTPGRNSIVLNETTMGIFDGKSIGLLSFCKNVMNGLINHKVAQIETDGVLEGIHRFELKHTMQLSEGRLLFEEHSIERIEFTITLWYQLEKTLPKIVARFDIPDRGHYLHLEIPDHFKGPVHAIMVWRKPPIDSIKTETEQSHSSS